MPRAAGRSWRTVAFAAGMTAGASAEAALRYKTDNRLQIGLAPVHPRGCFRLSLSQ
jgi:hypothetical protein